MFYVQGMGIAAVLVAALLSTTAAFAEREHDCETYFGLLSEVSASQQKTIVLTVAAADVVTSKECAPSKHYPPRGLAETQVLDWWLLHQPGEDVASLLHLTQRNRRLVVAALNKAAAGVERRVTWAMAKNDLRAAAKMAAAACGLSFQIPEGKSLRVTAVQQYPAPAMGYCLSMSLFAATHGLLLVDQGAAIMLSPSNNALQPTASGGG